METTSTTAADVVVVGGGTAGCIIASRIAEATSKSVLLIEAGPDFSRVDELPDQLTEYEGRAIFDPTSPYLDSFDSPATLRDGRLMQVVRGQLLGGSSAVNGCLFLRGTREDYDAWASPRWTYDAVLPSLRRLETDMDFRDEYHGDDGPVIVRRYGRDRWHPVQHAFHDAAVELGFAAQADMNRPGALGIGPSPLNNAGGIRRSTAQTHLRWARARPNLTVLAQTAVHRLVTDGTRVTGVEVAHAGTSRTIEAGEVILCAGAIRSPHLLLLSGIGPADALRAAGITPLVDLPGVGKNLRDHPGAFVEVEAATPQRDDGRTPWTQAVLTYTSEGSPVPADMQLLLSPWIGVAPETAQRGASDRLQVHVNLGRAESAGALTLQSADPTVKPRLSFGYLESDGDRRRMREGVRIGIELLRASSFGALRGADVTLAGVDATSDAELDAWLLATVATSQHTCGTARMGPDGDPEAVVDDRCRVRGVDGLRLADLSIAPDAPCRPTNATAMMIGEHAAALLLEEGQPAAAHAAA